jgi:signal transduction histidine kinase
VWLYAQLAAKEIKLSELFLNQSISIFDIAPKNSNPSLYDTIKVSFILTNDFDRDSIIYYTEGHCDWYSFYAAPLNKSYPVIHQLSGRDYFGKIPFDNVYNPAQKLLLKAGTSYNCIVKWKSGCYLKAGTTSSLITASAYFENTNKLQTFWYTNHIITFLFTGAIGFAFFFFLFLFYKSRYPLFGVYTAFLFMQILYAIILLDVYTIVGSLLIPHPNWDEYVTELVAFLGQAIYIQFIIGWLKIKQTSIRLARIFNMLSIFFFVYAISFFTIYTIAPDWQPLWHLKAGVRLLGLLFQLFLFYNIIFKIKTAGRFYILVGNVLFMIMAIIMIYIRGKEGFINTWFEDIDNASWYMLGVLSESICFSFGMGLHYFELKHEKDTLSIQSLQARQLQLEAEENNLNDRLRISQDLHDHIGSTLSSISVYSQVAKIHGEKKEAGDLNELLEKISSTSNDMITEMNDIVWAINPVNDSLEKIIQRMESFAKPLAAARNIHFDFQYDSTILSIHLDMDKRKNFYLIFKEAVNNAIKYSGASELTAEIMLSENKLVLKIQDNGVGFNPENEKAGHSRSLSGNGLRNMHARATELNAVLMILSLPGKGTAITLQLPVK